MFLVRKYFVVTYIDDLLHCLDLYFILVHIIKCKSASCICEVKTLKKIYIVHNTIIYIQSMFKLIVDYILYERTYDNSPITCV